MLEQYKEKQLVVLLLFGELFSASLLAVYAVFLVVFRDVWIESMSAVVVEELGEFKLRGLFEYYLIFAAIFIILIEDE